MDTSSSHLILGLPLRLVASYHVRIYIHTHAPVCMCVSMYIIQHKQGYSFDHRPLNVQSFSQSNRDNLAQCYITCSFICSTNTSKYTVNIRTDVSKNTEHTYS
jgi:hypothetical protein